MEKLNKLKSHPFFYQTNIPLVQKICLAGLFLALAMILQKVVAINYISILPFVRVSFGGCAMIILSSVLLGPWFGLLVGAGSDLLGYFIFDPKSYGLFPQITAIYALLGFSGYFIYCLVRYISKEKISEIALYSFSFIGILATALTFVFNDSIALFSTTYHLAVWQRVVIPTLTGVLAVALMVFIKLFALHFTKKGVELPFNVYQIALANLLLEVIVMILFGSLMKGCAFSFKTYPVILLSQTIVGFINIFINTVLISYIILITRKYFKHVSLTEEKTH